MISGLNSRLMKSSRIFKRKLNYIDDENSRRQTIAARYLVEIKNDKIILPVNRLIKKSCLASFL
jgi:dTDP-4-amino-4,6-dideoxygalactose transaminase